MEETTFVSEDNILHCFFTEKLNKFCLEFNAKLFTYKTKSAFIRKQNYFIEKYSLIKQSN